MNRSVHIVFIIGLIGFSTWLFYQEKAAEPGALKSVHEENTDCSDCHRPWQPVDDSSCVGCHPFPDILSLRPAIRFHEAGKHCLNCHSEHHGRTGNISRMEHKLLNTDLLCSDCHLDPHQNLFGEDCRTCHSMSTWSVAGYRHPSGEQQECRLCHRMPQSHRDLDSWRYIKKRHDSKVIKSEDVKPTECWKCHVLHDWRHLRM